MFEVITGQSEQLHWFGVGLSAKQILFQQGVENDL